MIAWILMYIFTENWLIPKCFCLNKYFYLIFLSSLSSYLSWRIYRNKIVLIIQKCQLFMKLRNSMEKIYWRNRILHLQKQDFRFVNILPIREWLIFTYNQNVFLIQINLSTIFLSFLIVMLAECSATCQS